MAVFKIARYSVKLGSIDEVESAIQEFARYVGSNLEDSTWTTYRRTDKPGEYVSLIQARDEEADQHHRNAPGTKRFVEVLYPNVVGEVEFTDYALLATSTDMAGGENDMP